MNMSQAVQLSKGLAKQHRAVLAVAEVMEEIVNLEAMRDEALKQCKESVAAKKNAESEKEQVEKDLRNAKEKEKLSKMLREDVIGKAHKDANIIIIEASDKAKKIMEEAHKQAHFASEDIKRYRNVHTEEMEKFDKEIQEKEVHLHKIKTSLARLKERLG